MTLSDTRSIVIATSSLVMARSIQEMLNAIPGYGAVTVDRTVAVWPIVAEINADLVVLDLEAEEIDVFQVYDLLHDRIATTAIPVLFVTAPEHESLLRRRQLTTYVVKPFDPPTLLAYIRGLFVNRSGAEGPD